jgi:SAM-dependent methyltransferase
MPKPDSRPRICDYEGSTYRTDFWEGKGRDYEDRVERIALRRLLPGSGRRLLEIGAGYGRLTAEYRAYDQIVLLDYSLSQLRFAQEQLGDSGRYLYVAADAYRMPFRPGAFDGATMIRVIHHISDVSSVLAEVRRALIPGGVFILEYANKRHLKAILRYAANRQSWSPYTLEPVEFVELNFDFHPEYIQRRLEAAGFTLKRSVPVSFFRLEMLKNHLPGGFLAGLDGLLQLTGLHVTPSVFTRSVAVNPSPNNLNHPGLFVCPDSQDELVRVGSTMVCKACRQRWAIRDGIYDFKAPLEE